ncbi:MAG: flavin reductase family protein [Atopobiaceae bacterium]|jgi:flavin reductase (DIM6/NTAB) family NADH-FMN oxidoreductase RutF
MYTQRPVDFLDYSAQILRAIPQGVLLTTQAQDELNTMTIGWGTMGTNWSRPVFEAYVRTGRYTAQMLEKHAEFTVNIPLDETKEQRKRTRKIMGICGTHHGNEVNKFEMAQLTPVTSTHVDVPGIAELPLTLECTVIYCQVEDSALYIPEIKRDFYPEDKDSSEYGSNKDPHLMVFGEIVGSYVIEHEE